MNLNYTEKVKKIERESIEKIERKTRVASRKRVERGMIKKR